MNTDKRKNCLECLSHCNKISIPVMVPIKIHISNQTVFKNIQKVYSRSIAIYVDNNLLI